MYGIEALWPNALYREGVLILLRTFILYTEHTRCAGEEEGGVGEITTMHTQNVQTDYNVDKTTTQ